MPTIYAFANQKGGVGKTTTAVNLAAFLADKGYQVLLVDLDAQGNATSSLGFERFKLNRSVYDALLGSTPLDQVIIPTHIPNLLIAASTAALAGAEVELAAVEGREYLLSQLLAPAVNRLDAILIDCPPSLGLLTINALTAAEAVVVPVQCEYLALEGLAQLLQTIALVRERLNPRLRLFGLLMTMFDARANLCEQVVEQVRTNFPEEVFQTVIPRSVRIAEAPSFGEPLLRFDRHSRGAQAYEQLTEEFLARADGGSRAEPAPAPPAETSPEPTAVVEDPPDTEDDAADVEYHGMLASTWDLFRGDTSNWPDRYFYREMIARYGQPALDVGCGTGRLLLDYLSHGIEIEGVDNSPEMLALCRAKAERLGLQPVLYEQRMERLDLPRRYRTILVPSSSFQLLIEPAQAALAIRRLYVHLEPGGALVMPFMLLWKPGNVTDTGWRITGEKTRAEDGAIIRRWSRSRFDLETRLEHTQDRYEVVVGEESVSSEYHQRSPATREYTQEQSVALYRQAGFVDVHLFAEFTQQPAGPKDWIWTVVGIRPPEQHSAADGRESEESWL